MLVVDDEEGIRSFIGEVLLGEGFQVTLAADGQEAVDLLARQSFHLMISDLNMPRIDGMALLRRVRAEQPEMEVIVLTAHGTVESAVEAMRLGAFDYLQKPLSGPDELRLITSRALERRRLLEDNRRLALHGEVEMVATDPAMRKVSQQLAKVAPTDASVLLEGESGTGKEVAARRLHALSPRRERPFVAVNCAALSAELLESELFGHEKGAFTGAVARKRGRFELADGGTLFLDEVAELKTELQAKLLRVIEERNFERVGGTRIIEVDIRLVAATNRNLKTEIENGRFREDLYHRLAVFPIRLPLLKDRPADILPLAEHLLVGIGRRLGKPGLALDGESRRVLRAHDWPGNVRELANVLERAAIMAEGKQIAAGNLLLVPFERERPSLDGTLKDLERQAISEALEATGGHRKKAAKRLGIGLRTLYDKLKEFDIG
ncbi:MAG TPA: sigma-54 dependent transcriptional regulator [Myxococcota bacterium]|nr:sigma-54 dependent transcriptional regulator [Myxococcota bacterium]